MSEMNLHTEEDRDNTRTVPVVSQLTEETIPEEKTPVRRRRADRYRMEEQEAESAVSAVYTTKPSFGAGSETAREVANRMQTRNRPHARESELAEPGSRIPPQAARMNAASRIRMAASQENRTSGRREGDYVGYAPGKMSESDRRAAYAAQNRMESARTAGLPSEWNGQSGMNTGREKERPRKKRRGWIVPVLLLLIAGLLFAGMHLIPDDNEGFPGTVKRTVNSLLAKLTGEKEEYASGVTGFIASGYENTVAPTDVSFSVTTTKDIVDIRLMDEDGEVLVTSRMIGNNTDQTLWNLTWHLTDGYEGEVFLQILTEKGWQDTEQSLSISVASLPTVNAEMTVPPNNNGETELPVVSVTEQPTEVPTEEPKEERTEEPAPAFTEESGDEPAAFSGGEAAEENETDFPEENEESGMEEEPGSTEEEWIPEEAESEDPESDEDGDSEKEAVPPEEQAVSVPVPAQTPEPKESPVPETTESPKLTAKACEEADPSLISTEIIYNGNKKASEYTRTAKEQITMPIGGEYTRQQMGVLTFRNDAFRRNAACGTVSGAASLEVAWTADAGSIKGASQTYYGIGWVGQPAIVKWSKEVRELSDIYDVKKEKSGLKEVIVAGLDGTIYFLDLADGTPTRNTIRLGYPMKGSPSVHPGGAPYMNVGQYARKMAKGTGRIGLRQYNLYTGKEMNLIDGTDGSNRRPFNGVGSFETSSLMDRTSDALITAGTNGLLYVINMGSTFDYQMGNYTQSPGTVLLKTKAKGESDADTAIEASVAMYDRYVFYADMGGILRCVDTNTMKTVWAADTKDSVESTVALDLNPSDGLDLYTANLLNKRKKGNAQIRCFDAMSGEEKWMVEYEVRKDTKKNTVSGFRASPVVGENDLDSLVYYTVNGLSEAGAESLGLSDETTALIALDKRTGNRIWVKGLTGLAYSSPVAVYDEKGYGWIIQCTGDGKILLMDGLTGRTVSELQVKGAIEGSPAVYNSMMVVGTTEKGANHIYGIRILSE